MIDSSIFAQYPTPNWLGVARGSVCPGAGVTGHDSCGYGDVMSVDELVVAFWASCRNSVDGLPERVPDAWAFGASEEQADRLLELVLSGAKTATASSLWDYEVDQEALPAAGDFSIVLDGRGAPRAVVQTLSVEVVPFDEVTERHARAEGEGDLSLREWREAHERFWRAHSLSPRGFDARMPVVCETFRLVHGLQRAVT